MKDEIEKRYKSWWYLYFLIVFFAAYIVGCKEKYKEVPGISSTSQILPVS